MSRTDFIAAYVTMDPDEREYYTSALPCPFLGSDDCCTIYDVRPECCRTFPNTDKPGFIHRVYQHSSNTLTCSAVYHIVRRLRNELRP
jgi:uncharacterized protein